MSEMTHKPEALFAIEDEPSHPDLSRGLANYRRLNASERAACAAELKRRVEIEIVDQKCSVSATTKRFGRRRSGINIRCENSRERFTHKAPMNVLQRTRLDRDPILPLAILTVSDGVACRGPTKRTMVRNSKRALRTAKQPNDAQLGSFSRQVARST